MRTETKFDTIFTLEEKCRVCYTCVRECPAKAIRIVDGQARVLHERCIGCGNCVRVCSQGAKQVVDSVPRVRDLLGRGVSVAAVIAPSFPAEFSEYDHTVLAGMIRALGFEWVNEVAFGADLVAKEYRLQMEGDAKSAIATSCPAVVLYVEKYFPDLIGALAPVVSPMVAQARIMRKLHGDNIRVVFIGPCTAKKREGVDEKVEGEIDAVLTYAELRAMFREAGLTPDVVEAKDFDEPYGALGALFPLCGGMLQAAELHEDLVKDDIVSANKGQFTEAIKEYESGSLQTRLLEMLACDGCITGAGMTCEDAMFKRRGRVSRYVREIAGARDVKSWQAAMDEFKDLDLSRQYTNYDQRLEVPADDVVLQTLRRMGKFKLEDELNCGACGYQSCREHAIAIHKGLAESEMCLPYTIDRLNEAVCELEDSNTKLATTQEALMQSERLASMGQLAAGIAHEVNNPLGVVLMYAHLLLDDLGEDTRHAADAKMIAEQADRCKKIVSGLLHFARQNKVLRETTSMVELVDRSVQSVLSPGNITVTTKQDQDEVIAEIDADQILQVLTNLISNAYAAMPEGGNLELSIRDGESRVLVVVKDSGTGISPENRSKIFEPFFTTKQIGKGTGLGLAVTYGIVKMHKGNITMETNDDPELGQTGTTFTVDLPKKEEE